MSDLFDNKEPVIDPNKDYSTELVGEGKKFKDIPALARSKVEGDFFVGKLQNENKELRDELQKRLTLEEVMTKLAQTKAESNKEVITPLEGNQPQALTKEQLEAFIAEKVGKSIQETRAEAEARQNFEHVKAELKKAWGLDFQGRLEAKASELGLGKEWLTQLAGQKPTAFLTLVGVSGTKPSGSNSAFDITPSGVSAASIGDGNRGEKTQKYYNQLKLSDPNKYFSKSTQKEMYDQAMKLGEAYFD